MELGQLERGVFLERVNRFVARVRTEKGEELAHLSNSGRLTDVAAPGNPVRLRRLRHFTHRRTALDVVLIQSPAGVWVGADTRLPPGLLVEAVENGLVPPFTGGMGVKREVKWGDSRFDLKLDDWLVETKSVTLVRHGTGLFPDAPTLRGQRHLRSLREAQKTGVRTMVVFVVQRSDANRLMAHSVIDPVFAEELRRAGEAGVSLRAFVSQIYPDELFLDKEIPVEM